MEKLPNNHPIRPNVIEGNKGRSKVSAFHILHRLAMLTLFAGSVAALDSCAFQKQEMIQAPDVNPQPIPEWITGMIPGAIEFRARSRGTAGVIDEAYGHVAAQMDIGIDDAQASYSITEIEFDRNTRTVRAKVSIKDGSDVTAKTVSTQRDLDRDHDLESLRHQMFTLVNEDRKANLFSVLEADRLLDQFAQYRSDEIAKRGVSSPENINLNSVQSVLKKNKIENMPISENIAIFQNPKDAEFAWMEDSGSRDSILSKQFRHVGFGVTKRKDGFLVLVQLFSRPDTTPEELKNFQDLSVNIVDTDSLIINFMKFIGGIPEEFGLSKDIILDGQLDMKRLKEWATRYVDTPDGKMVPEKKLPPPETKKEKMLAGEEFVCYPGDKTPEQAAIEYFAKNTGLSTFQVEADYTLEIVKSQKEGFRRVVAKMVKNITEKERLLVGGEFAYNLTEDKSSEQAARDFFIKKVGISPELAGVALEITEVHRDTLGTTMFNVERKEMEMEPQVEAMIGQVSKCFTMGKKTPEQAARDIFVKKAGTSPEEAGVVLIITEVQKDSLGTTLFKVESKSEAMIGKEFKCFAMGGKTPEQAAMDYFVKKFGQIPEEAGVTLVITDSQKDSLGTTLFRVESKAEDMIGETFKCFTMEGKILEQAAKKYFAENTDLPIAKVDEEYVPRIIKSQIEIEDFPEIVKSQEGSLRKTVAKMERKVIVNPTFLKLLKAVNWEFWLPKGTYEWLNTIKAGFIDDQWVVNVKPLKVLFKLPNDFDADLAFSKPLIDDHGVVNTVVLKALIKLYLKLDTQSGNPSLMPPP